MMRFIKGMRPNIAQLSNGAVRIRNRWQTDSIIHVENQTGSAQYNGGQNNWDSTQWQFQSTTTAKIDGSKTEINTENNATIGIYPNPAINCYGYQWKKGFG